MLNIACGSRIHNDWENIDFSPMDKRVKKVNLLSTLPYADSSFDVAYSSHFLEHLDKDTAPRVLKEIRRILKPNGILRIVVPDLENMVNEYLRILHSSQIQEDEYDWIMIEIFDQMVRMNGGGGNGCDL